MFFNDSTKIVLDPHGHHLDYMERRTSDKQDTIQIHTLTNYPKELQKKVTLLEHFRGYLEGEKRTEPVVADSEPPKRKLQDIVYVKKWMRTRHAIMFRLSNKIVQVNFQDHTEIVLSSETRMVTYVDKKGERLTYPLASALESANLEMSKRLKYTKDILTHMLSNFQPEGCGSGKAAAMGTTGGFASSRNSNRVPGKGEGREGVVSLRGSERAAIFEAKTATKFYS